MLTNMKQSRLLRGDIEIQWPLSVHLEPGEHAQFGIPVTKPGLISVCASITGEPIVLALKQPNRGTVCTETAVAQAESRLLYEVARDELSQGVLWIIELSLAQGANADTTVRLTAEYPPFERDRLMNELEQIRRKVAAASHIDPTLVREIEEKGRARLRQLEQDAQAELAGRYTALQDRIDRSKLENNRRATRRARPITESLKAPHPPIAKPPIDIPPIESLNKVFWSQPPDGPQLNRIVPNGGYPGDHVTLMTDPLPAPEEAHVYFWLSPTILEEGKVMNWKAGATGTEFEVAVPSPPEWAKGLSSYEGKAFVAYTAKYCTNAMPFQFHPLPQPHIMSVDPLLVEPNTQITLHGTGFGSKVGELQLTGKSNRAMTVQHWSDTQIIALVPPYTLERRPQTASLWVTSRGVVSNLMPITLLPTTPFIESIQPTSAAPGTPIVITGSGFLSTAGTVQLQHPTAAPASAEIRFWSPNEIHAIVPSIGKFDSDQTVAVSVGREGSSSSPVNMTMTPKLVYDYIDVGKLAEARTDVQFNEGDDIDGYNASSTYEKALHAWHYGSEFFGHKGDDYWFPHYRLHHGWQVVDVEFYVWCDPEEANAHLVETRLGTNSLYMKVHWWDTPCIDQVTYYIRVLGRGPEGFDPLDVS